MGCLKVTRFFMFFMLPVLVGGLGARVHHRRSSASVLALKQDALGEKQHLMTKAGLGSAQAPTKVTYTSWFDRMKDSMTAFVMGIVLIVFSIPVLWFNESRVAQMESLLSIGKSQVRTVSSKSPEKENQNWLVHVDGAMARSAAEVSDTHFNVSFDSNCIRLCNVVEMYQVIEHSKSEEKEKLGGGKETITTYTYTEEWSSIFHDSSNFYDRNKRVNHEPRGLQIGAHTQDCSRVEFGEGFLLSDGLISQCSNWTSAFSRLPDTIRVKDGSREFRKGDNEYFCCSAGAGASRGGAPQLGDLRVRFRYVPDHEATVLALQVEAEELRDSFLPYRPIQRGWFSMPEDQEKKALFKQGKKNSGDLASDASCTGCFAVLCCACNLVNMCCQSILTPEIYHLFEGSVDDDKCFKIVAQRLLLSKWALRAGGWLMMFIGFYSLFTPFLTLIKVIPFLGPLVAAVGGWLIWILCFLGTFVISSVIVVVAYWFYRPLMAFIYGSLATVAVTGIYMLTTHA